MTLDPRAQFEDDRRLTQWLAMMYRSDVLGVGSIAQTTAAAQHVMDADQRLQAAAKRRLAELEPVCAGRDKQSAYVEHKQLAYLKKIMEGVTANG